MRPWEHRVLGTYSHGNIDTIPNYYISICLSVSAPQAPHAPLYQTPVSVSTSSLFTPHSTRQQSVFLILGLCKKDVARAIMELDRLYQNQCSKQIFQKKDLEDLTQENIDDLTHLIEMLGLCVEENRDTWTVSGLNDEVNQVMQMYHVCLHGSLQREMRGREEEEVYGRVAWCILGLRGDWERLPKAAHHDLEKKDVRGGIVDAQGVQWNVNLAKLEAVAVARRQTTQLKRLENLAGEWLVLYRKCYTREDCFNKTVTD